MLYFVKNFNVKYLQKTKNQSKKHYMRTIELKRIIDALDLDKKEIARHLFPEHKHKMLALNRVIEGHSLLNSSQISKLASMAGVSIQSLFGLEWKARKKGDVMTLTSQNYRAELNTKTWVTKIFDTESLFHESIIHQGSTPLSTYLIELTKIISNYKTNEKTNPKKDRA